MIRLFRRLLLLGFAALLLAAGAVALWCLREWHRDPMDRLDRGPAAYRVVAERETRPATQDGERRIFRQVVLDGGLGEPVRFTVSLPARHARPLPVLVILGGLEIGQQSLGYIGRHGPNALVAYEYPGRREAWYEGLDAARLPAIRRAALEVPSQVEALLAWVLDQPWTDRGRVSLMGYSFGAVFLPAVARLAQEHGRSLGPAVLAYGGADLPSLLEANLPVRPPRLKKGLALALGIALRPLEPSLHAPRLRGECLFINGRRDTLIPPANALALQEAVPGPRTVVWLEAGHMDPGDPLLLAEIIHVSREWLEARGALDR